jgi:FkbM family methyltransferase
MILETHKSYILNKENINKFLRRFGFEIHGNGYMQSLKKTSFKEDAFEVQYNLLSGNADCIFDIGANRGDTAKKYASLFNKAKIYAFEPFPDTYSKLLTNTKEIKQIIPNTLAIADFRGDAILYSNHNEDTNSLLPSIKMGLSSDQQVRNKGSLTIPTDTIDNFCKENNIDQIAILKLDIQGSELAALKGAVRMLEKKKIKVIYTETYFRQQYKDQPLFHDIASFLFGYGYAIQDIYSPIYGNGKLAWSDAIFVSE